MEMTLREDFKEMLAAVQQAIQESLLDEKNLWTNARCAAYLGYSPRYFKRSIATLKGFPTPIVLPTAEKGGDERYDPKEVKAWAKRFQKG